MPRSSVTDFIGFSLDVCRMHVIMLQQKGNISLTVGCMPPSGKVRITSLRVSGAWRFTCMWACHWQGHSGSKAGLGALVGNLLGSLPLLRAPLRSLILQRGKNAPMLGAIKISCADLTVCLTCIVGELVPSFPFAEYHLGFSRLHR